MAETPIGDLVLFEDDERVDAVDVRALQVLIYQCIADALGGLMGETSGVLGGVTFDTTAGPGAVGVGECTLCGFSRVSGSSARVEGLIMHYNPAGAYQIQKTLPTLASYSSSDRPYLWFARAESPADRATRKKFSAGAERTITPMTRLRQNVLFGVTASRTTPPDETSDWFVFAQVTAWSGGSPNIPTIRAFRPWDIGRNDAQSASSDLYYPGRRVEQINASNGTPYLNGLPRVLTYLAQVLALTRDNAMEFAHDGSTVVLGSDVEALPLVLDGGALWRGTKQLDADLTALDTRVGTIETATAEGVGASQVLFIGRAVYDGGLSEYVVTTVYVSNLLTMGDVSHAWADSDGAHLVNFQIARNGTTNAPVVIKGVSVQPLVPWVSSSDLGNLETGAVFPIFPVVAVNGSFPITVPAVPFYTELSAGMAKHGTTNPLTGIVGHDGTFMIYIYGGPG